MRDCDMGQIEYPLILHVYNFSAIILLIFVLLNKKPPKDGFTTFLILAYGFFALDAFYNHKPIKAVPRLIVSLINLPFHIIFVDNLMQILDNAYADPSYGACLLSFLGGIIPCLIQFCLCLNALDSYAYNSK